MDVCCILFSLAIHLHLTTCNQCLSPLTILWVQIPLRRGVLDTTLCDKVCQWFAAGRWFSPGSPFSSTNKTGRSDIIWIFNKKKSGVQHHKPNQSLICQLALTYSLTVYLYYTNGNIYFKSAPDSPKFVVGVSSSFHESD